MGQKKKPRHIPRCLEMGQQKKPRQEPCCSPLLSNCWSANTVYWRSLVAVGFEANCNRNLCAQIFGGDLRENCACRFNLGCYAHMFLPLMFLPLMFLPSMFLLTQSNWSVWISQAKQRKHIQYYHISKLETCTSIVRKDLLNVLKYTPYTVVQWKVSQTVYVIYVTHHFKSRLLLAKIKISFILSWDSML